MKEQKQIEPRNIAGLPSSLPLPRGAGAARLLGGQPLSALLNLSIGFSKPTGRAQLKNYTFPYKWHLLSINQRCGICVFEQGLAQQSSIRMRRSFTKLNASFHASSTPEASLLLDSGIAIEGVRIAST